MELRAWSWRDDIATLARDRVVQAFGVVFAAELVLYLAPVLTPVQREAFGTFYCTMPFVAITAWGALSARRKVLDPEERRVLSSIGVAFLFWLAALIFSAALPDTGVPDTIEVMSDVFYLGTYLSLLLAIERQPHLGAAVGLVGTDRRLRAVGVVCVVCGWFAYFVLIPAAFDQPFYQTAMPSYYFYLTLDAILVARCLTLARRCPSRRWRGIYFGLAAGALANGLVDVIETLSSEEVLPFHDGDLTDLVWASPMLVFLVVARMSLLPRPGDEVTRARDATEPVDFDPVRSGNLLVVMAFTFPLLHLWLYSTRILTPNLERAHSLLVLLELAIISSLAITAYLALARRHRELGRQRQAVVARLMEAQRMEALGQLAGGVAHDFNNLLTAIAGYNDMAMQALGPEDPNRSLLEEVAKAANRAGTLTRQLLAFSRRQTLRPETLDLNRVVTRMEQMLRRLIGEDISLVIRLEPQLGPIVADPGQMEFVIVHLASNARDAMPRGGTLVIATSDTEADQDACSRGVAPRPGSYVQLTVSDSGVGISPAVLPHIFDPFFSTKARDKGTGLGLAAIHGFITQSGGSIQAESAPDRGSTFVVRLPRAVGGATSTAEALPIPSSSHPAPPASRSASC